MHSSFLSKYLKNNIFLIKSSISFNIYVLYYKYQIYFKKELAMDNLKDKFWRFMYGRNGVDNFSHFLFYLFLLLTIVDTFAQTYILSIFAVFIMGYINFRIFSKKRYRRQYENAIYSKYKFSILRSYKLQLRRIKEIRTARFRKCTSCGQVLRVKRKIGKHSIACPKCNKKVDIHIVI